MATCFGAAGTTTTSMVAAAFARPQLPPTSSFSQRCSLPHLPPRPVNLQLDSNRFSSLKIRATSSEESSGSIEVGEIVSDLKEKWDAVEDKQTALLYGGGAIVGIWVSSIIVGAVNSVPLLPKIFELVGLGYTGWFVYRYLLYKTSRKELANDIEALKKKIAGTE